MSKDKSNSREYRGKSGGGTATFMMEMIMVIFFFIMCASTCILVFAKADRMSKLAKDTNQGVLAAESVAEIWKAEGAEGLQEWLGAVEIGAGEHLENAEQGRGSYAVFWDSDWNVLGSEEAAYRAVIIWTTADDLSTAEIKVTRLNDQEELISLEAKQYLVMSKE